MSEKNLESIAKKLDNLIILLSKPKVADNQELWSDAQCAAYLGYSESNFRQRIACDPTFPKRIVLNEGGKQETKRWIKKEVITWALAKQLTA